jgi:Protein of unknown function (DUF2970)
MTEPQSPAPDDGLKAAVRRKGSFFGTLKAVAWSFFGVRRRKDHEQDLAELNPVHVIIAGLGAAALFVVALVVLVRWVLQAGVAG